MMLVAKPNNVFWFCGSMWSSSPQATCHIIGNPKENCAELDVEEIAGRCQDRNRWGGKLKTLPGVLFSVYYRGRSPFGV